MVNHYPSAGTGQPAVMDSRFELLLRPSEGLLRVEDVMSRNVLTTSPDALLADVAANMGRHNVSCIVVLEEDVIVGILSESDFLKAVAGDYGELYQLHVSDAMSTPVQHVRAEQTILEAAQKMEACRIRRLPVVGHTELIGIITQTDLIQAQISVGAHHTVDGIMSLDVITIPISSTVASMSGLMDSQEISCMIVEQAGIPVGIVSERDILRKVTGARKDPNTLKAGDIMSAPLVSIAPGYSIFSAARLLSEKRLHRLVVMEDDRLCGIVTQTDIFQATRKILQDQEQARLQQLEDSSSMVFMLDPECCVTYCNPAFRAFLAVEDPDEIINRPFLPERFWVTPGERSHYMAGLSQRTVQQEELALKTARGDKLYVIVFCMFSEEGLGSQGVLYDITVRKTTAQALKVALEQTEQAHDRLKAMQSQLVQNEKLASIGQLAAGVAHEMNTPVGFVASNFETLATYVNRLTTMFNVYDGFVDQVASSGQDEFKHDIQELKKTYQTLKLGYILHDIEDLFAESQEGLRRVTSIVQNLRDFSRIDQQQKRDDYNINDCIKSTLIVAKNEIKYDADIETDLAEIPLVPCHAGQINQVLLNILVNAVHAIKDRADRQGKGVIRIKTHATDDHVVCEIQDDGSGIREEKLSKIFDPFFTTKPVGKGTGLGLSVSHDIIVNKHQGQIFVTSTVGCGTTFTIQLPIRGNDNRRSIKTIDCQYSEGTSG